MQKATAENSAVAFASGGGRISASVGIRARRTARVKSSELSASHHRPVCCRGQDKSDRAPDTLARRPRACPELEGTGAYPVVPTFLPSPEFVMRKVILVPALLCGMAVIAGAQTKISGKLTCAKPAVRETGGSEGQTIMFQRSNCTWTTPFTIDGSKPGATVNVSIGDMSGATGRTHGYSTSVFETGDTTIVRYEGTM